ncbi:MAG: hypothetical protein LC725_02695 [Lentisphaerae bacterium]|nr:hypothetical protein [Lentisphaerota bacterium]
MNECKKSRWGYVAVTCLLNLLFLFVGLQWVFLIPYNRAPDENNHFRYSVRLIMENHRLPVAGVDDVECFRNAASSYNKFPALNYLTAAMGAGIAGRWGDARAYLGARMVSLVWGLLFLNFLLAAAWRLSHRCLPSFMAVGTVVLIPQVIFISSYVNADAFALAVSGLLAWSVARLLQDTSRSNIWLFCYNCSAPLVAGADRAGKAWFFQQFTEFLLCTLRLW